MGAQVNYYFSHFRVLSKQRNRGNRASVHIDGNSLVSFNKAEKSIH